MARRSVLALAALTLPAGCASVHRSLNTIGPRSVPPAPSPSAPPPPPSPSPTSSPSLSAPPSKTAATHPAAAPSPPKSDGRGGPVPFTPGKLMLGSYLALGGLSLNESLALRRRQLGREQRIVHRFYPWDGYVPTSEPDVSRHSVLMVSWHGTAYSRINDGSSDELIASVARKLAGMKRPILLRWGWEMNGDWFEWDGSHNGQDPGAYVKAWRRIHGIFRRHGATDVAWVWSPNWNSAPAAAWNKFQRYYPGDDYVDWVGVSGYDFYDESPATLFSAVAGAYGSRKPIILSETAAVDLGVHTKARWIKKLSAWAAKTPSLGAVVWFDTDTQDGTDHNFRPDTDAEALAAYRTMVRSGRFTG
ncbi:glycosyl hydrolase [Actinoplanes sp. NPDC051411]|uniref:glycoside hydrolase family 26 protein n=1 Tax=Actinoplanes sp. NPDC051411 TaxID=3155522 RepID=UPI00342A419D